MPALLLIDIQRDFVEPHCHKIASSGKGLCLPGAKHLLTHARDQGWRVVHVGTRHESHQTLPSKLRGRGYPPFCVPNTRGIEFCIDCKDGESVLYKKHFSAFSEPNLRSCLDGTRRVVVAGVSVDCCVLKTAFDASELGFECVVGLQAVSATREEDYVSAVRILSKSVCKIADVDLLASHGLSGSYIEDTEVEKRARSWYRSVNRRET